MLSLEILLYCPLIIVVFKFRGRNFLEGGRVVTPRVLIIQILYFFEFYTVFPQRLDREKRGNKMECGKVRACNHVYIYICIVPMPEKR
jgi:hypothetical protein